MPLQNKKGAAPKQALKESTKKAKKAKFDQSQSHSTSQKKQAMETATNALPSAPAGTGAGNGADAGAKRDGDASADTGAAAGAGDAAGNGANKGSIQDLRERLHARIEALRQKRKAPDGGDEQGDGISKRRRRAQRKAELIRNRAAGIAPPPRQPRGAFAKADATSGASTATSGATSAAPALTDAAAPVAVPLAIDYGVVKFGSGVTSANRPKKGHMLQQLLAKACVTVLAPPSAELQTCVTANMYPMLPRHACICCRRKRSRHAWSSYPSTSATAYVWTERLWSRLPPPAHSPCRFADATRLPRARSGTLPSVVWLVRR